MDVTSEALTKAGWGPRGGFSWGHERFGDLMFSKEQAIAIETERKRILGLIDSEIEHSQHADDFDHGRTLGLGVARDFVLGA